MIKGVIFDMDGILIDSEPLWQEAEVRAFSNVGLHLAPEMMIQTMGLRVDEVVEYWYARRPWADVSREQVAADIVQNVIDLVKEKGERKEGVKHAIEFFEKRGIPMAIASSSFTSVINAVLEKLDIRNRISVVHSAEHEPYGKPHPGVYITAAEKLGVDREECVAFEDSPNGVLAAKSARMQCVAVPYIEFKNDSKIAIADLILTSLSEISDERLACFSS